VFEEASFDVILCNGVLHHTSDPRKGLSTLARLLRPDGYIVVGLYHQYGRILTDLRRLVFRIGGESLSFLDPRIRKSGLKGSRRAAWFADQYRNPHESKHTISEVLGWLDGAGLRFVKSIPKTQLMSSFSADERLFEPEAPGSAVARFIKEAGLAFRSDPEGGFFTIIAQRNQ
jgi:SAM-dependent methyltransferase